MKAFFASTAGGLEELLKAELEGLGAEQCRITQGGVYFSGDSSLMYRSLLWSRLASRILMPLSEFNVYNDNDLYIAANMIEWSELFDVSATFVVHFNGTNDEIRNSQYGALKVKDAIVDHFNRRLNKRPNVTKQWADIRINVFLNKNRAVISLDLSGDSLHQRGYRQQSGIAPLKENLAAAIVMRSGWQVDTPMVDPMCGSGTLLIEAAMMAADVAPGLQREYWGFQQWLGHQPELWQNIQLQAQQRANDGLATTVARFYGYDHDSKMIEIAKRNARQAGVERLITLQKAEITQLNNPFAPTIKGTVLSNPPYGERLESEPALIALHTMLGRLLKQHYTGWQLSLFSAAPQLLNCLQLRANRQFKAKNGPLNCIQKNYLLSAKPQENITPLQTDTVLVAKDYANRLKKNVAKFDKWAKQQGIECYRIYDADLPDYNVAVDRYADRVIIQEYAPPKSIDAEKARQRLFDVINATLVVLEIPSSHLILKTRERQKGKQQYQKMAEKGDSFLVTEYNAKFWVNLTDYLDTGLFLDHRLARKMIGEMSKGKDFLNLFAYTGSASVYAGLGGARTTTTVDMSRTYLEWAERNFQANGLIGRQHCLIQADCLQWLQECTQQFDLIFIDPPTFSNSKRMEENFDVQRDHLKLMQDLKRIVRKDGTIVFSNNKRGFKMDLAGLQQLGLVAKEISQQTLSLDFARNRQIHNCWLITPAQETLCR